MATIRQVASFVVVLFAILISVCRSEAQDYRGTDFWLGFPQNARSENGSSIKLPLFITSSFRSSGKIIKNLTNDTVTFSVEPGASITVEIDSAYQAVTSEELSRASVHVISDHDISLYALNTRKASTDSYMAIPTVALGENYLAAGFSPPTTENGFTSQFEVIATEDNTLVTITPSAPTQQGIPAGHSFSIAMSRGQVFQVQSHHDSSNGDLTGSIVTATKPIAFVTGHTCAQVPNSVNFCDVLMEMEPPSQDWGKDFFVTGFEGKDRSIVRVIASMSNTEIKVDGKYAATIARSRFYEFSAKSDCRITTSNPVVVAQYSTSADDDSVRVGDPFMMILTPTDRFVSHYDVVGIMNSTSEAITHPQPIASEPVWSDTSSIRSMERRKGELARERWAEIMGDTTGFSEHGGSFVYDMVGKSGGRYSGSGWEQTLNIFVPEDGLQSLTFDGRHITEAIPIGKTGFSRVRCSISTGPHAVDCKLPIGVYSYGFGKGNDNYDSYGHSCGGRLDTLNK